MSLSSKTELARALFRSTPPESVTRISGTATADSSDGTVTVQLEDGDVIEVGTIGSVSAGDTVTIHVQRGEAQVIASEGWGDAMQAAVGEATAIAEATGQHFWSDTNGAHVTQVTQEEWETTPTGPNALWNSLGMLLRNALTNLAAFTTGNVRFYDGNGNAASNVTASFGSAGAQIGKTGESHIEMDYHSLRLIDKDGQEYFKVEDMRGQQGTASIVETWTGDGSTMTFTLTYMATDTIYSVSVNNVETGATKTEYGFTFLTAPAAGSSIKAMYRTTESVQAMTFGTRGDTAPVGASSVSEGFLNAASGARSHAGGDGATASGYCSFAHGIVAEASGYVSHAEGSKTVASGDYGHAQNIGTIAQGDAQTAVGRFNVADSTSALIIGNGDSNARSNALTVDWDGNVDAAGGLTLGGKAVAAWVVETGTDSNGWAYEKRSDGTYRAKWSNDLTRNAGTAWGSGFYFHMQTAAIPVPSFSTSFEVVSAVKNNAQLAFYAGRVASTTALQGYWANNGSGAVSSSTFGKVTYIIEGTY